MVFNLFSQFPEALRSLWPQSAVRLSNKGERLRERGKLDEAVALLDEAIGLDPQLAEAYAHRCACYSDREEYAKAIEDADRAIALDPEMACAFRYRARAACSLNQFESAISDLTRVLQLEPEEPCTYYHLAGVRYGMGEYEAAIADIDRFLEKCPKTAAGYQARAWSRLGLHQLDAALADIDEALRLEPKNAGFRCHRANILYESGRIDEASAQYESALVQDPDLKGGWLGGAILLKQAKFREAIEHFDAALEADPTIARMYYDRGQAWHELGDHEGALRDLDEAVRLDPEVGAYLYFRAELLCKLHRFEEAFDEYEAALVLKPSWRNGASSLKQGWLAGAIALKQGNYWEAIAQFGAVLEADPTIARVYNDCGEAWYQMEEYERAWSDFDKAVTLAPENPVQYINRANALMGLRRYADAKRDLVEARRRGPDSAHSYRYLAWYMATCPEAEFRDGEQAVAMAHKAVELAGGKPDSRHCAVLAAAYAEDGDFAEAIRWQTEALATATDEQRPNYQARLEQYQAGKPYRMPDSEDSES